MQFNGIQSYNITPPKDGKVEIEAQLKVKNPNNFRMTLKRYEFEVRMNNECLGIVKSNKKMVFRKMSEDEYPIRFSLDYQKIMGQAINSIGSLLQGKPPEITFRGYAKVRALGVSKKFPFEFNEKLKLPK